MSKTITNLTRNEAKTVLRILDMAIEAMEEKQADLEALQTHMDDETNDYVDMQAEMNAEREHEAN